jgi:hypothetical protein
MKTLTRRERLRRCYFYEDLDRPAAYCMRMFPTDDPSYDRLKDYLGEHTELKGRWGTEVCQTPYETETRVEPHSEDWDRQITVLRTPAGPLERTSLVSRKGQPGLHETLYLKTREDAEKYLSLPLPATNGDVSRHFQRDREVADRGMAEAALNYNAAGFVVELFGSELFALMSLTDRDVIHALCERELQILTNRVKHLLSEGVGPLFSLSGQEYIVPPMHGPEDFRDFNMRYDRPIIDLIHEGGGRVYVHCHGSVKRVIDGFVEAGVDVLHPFEPPPLGDITAAEAKAVARGCMCLEGNIQINRMYERRPDEIREEARALIRDAFDDRRGLIVCPTASPYIRDRGEDYFARFRAMMDAVLEAAG